MDPGTLEYYTRNAAELTARYDGMASPFADRLTASFPRGARLLDVGAGSGRDLSEFVARGYDAYGVEPVRALRQHAEKHYPHLRRRIISGSLPGLGKPFGGGFNGVTCSAVLMHLGASELTASVEAMRANLKRHGRVMLSLPQWRSAPDETSVSKGVLHVAHTPEAVQEIFAALGFRAIGRWINADAFERKRLNWVTLLFELQDAQTA